MLAKIATQILKLVQISNSATNTCSTANGKSYSDSSSTLLRPSTMWGEWGRGRRGEADNADSGLFGSLSYNKVETKSLNTSVYV